MKKLCFITILVFLVANLLLSQNIYQATRWAVQGYEIDFTSSTPTVFEFINRNSKRLY